MKEYKLKDFLPSTKIDDIRGWKISFDWDLDNKKAILYKAGEIIDKASISPDITKEITIELVAPISAVYSFSKASFERYNSISYINKRIDALIEDNFIICKAYDNNRRLLKEFSLMDFLPPTLIETTRNRKISFIPTTDYNKNIFYKNDIFFSKGEIIAKASIQYDYLNFSDYEVELELFSPETAIFDFSAIFLNLPESDDRCLVDELLDKNIVLCRAFSDYEELARFRIDNDCNYSIIDDVFKNERRIDWKYNLYEKHFNFSIGYIRKVSSIHSIPLDVKGVKPFVTLQNSKEQVVFQYPKKGFSTHKFVKGDVFHFVFEDEKHLKFQLKSDATNTNDPNLKQVSFSLLPQDINQFANNNVVAIRCEFQNGDTPLDLEWENEASTIMLKFYFQKYIEALLECGVDIDKIPAASESIKRPINELDDELIDTSCFVYLMKDESNGYHKIGISNKPEYRERTLQSEKPTIVLLCAKKFPSRVIAEAIEAALHKAYGNKRLRGEWFELDDKDVFDIKTTLS